MCTKPNNAFTYIVHKENKKKNKKSLTYPLYMACAQNQRTPLHTEFGSPLSYKIAHKQNQIAVTYIMCSNLYIVVQVNTQKKKKGKKLLTFTSSYKTAHKQNWSKWNLFLGNTCFFCFFEQYRAPRDMQERATKKRGSKCFSFWTRTPRSTTTYFSRGSVS